MSSLSVSEMDLICSSSSNFSLSRAIQSGSKPHSAPHKTRLSPNPNAKALMHARSLYVASINLNIELENNTELNQTYQNITVWYCTKKLRSYPHPPHPPVPTNPAQPTTYSSCIPWDATLNPGSICLSAIWYAENGLLLPRLLMLLNAANVLLGIFVLTYACLEAKAHHLIVEVDHEV